MRSLGSIRLILALAVTFPSIALSAQSVTETTPATIQLPRLIRINGILAQPPGTGVLSSVDLTFALYAEESGGEPIWQETQSIEVDATGHYTVLLGSTQPEGLPHELFNSAQAQWLGVTRQGEAEQPRIMLVSVPFALKAGDAETLGGMPASAFALAVPQVTASNGVLSLHAHASGSSGSSNPHALAITGGGTTNYLPMWESATELASSPVYENKTSHNLGIGTTAPAAALEVVNNTEAPMLAQTSGKNLSAIQGTNVGTTGSGAGVYGSSSAPTGSGVYGTSSTLDGSGVYGTASGTNAVGVWGVSSATSGNGNGVYGSAASPGSYAAGVWGHSSAGGGNGTVGSCSGNDGCTGVWGYSSATTGSNWGVYG